MLVNRCYLVMDDTGRPIGIPCEPGYLSIYFAVLLR